MASKHVQLTDSMIQRSVESDEEELDLQVDYTADIQRSLDESKLSIQRFDRYEIESDEEELQVDYTAGNMNQRPAGNMNQISDESDEEEY